MLQQVANNNAFRKSAPGMEFARPCVKMAKYRPVLPAFFAHRKCVGDAVPASQRWLGQQSVPQSVWVRGDRLPRLEQVTPSIPLHQKGQNP
jgi:hypothetical protein